MGRRRPMQQHRQNVSRGTIVGGDAAQAGAQEPIAQPAPAPLAAQAGELVGVDESLARKAEGASDAICQAAPPAGDLQEAAAPAGREAVRGEVSVSAVAAGARAGGSDGSVPITSLRLRAQPGGRGRGAVQLVADRSRGDGARQAAGGGAAGEVRPQALVLSRARRTGDVDGAAGREGAAEVAPTWKRL